MGALVCIDHFQDFCKDFSQPWNTNTRVISTQTGMVATWSLGENHPTLWLVRFRVKITQRYGWCEFGVKITRRCG